MRQNKKIIYEWHDREIKCTRHNLFSVEKEIRKNKRSRTVPSGAIVCRVVAS